METKVCRKCPENGEQSIDNFGIKKHTNGKYYRRSHCKRCCCKEEKQRISKIEKIDDFYKQQYQKYKDIHKKNSINYYKNNKDIIKARSAKWAKENPIKRKIQEKNTRKLQSDKLSDNHIKREIIKHSIGLKYKDISIEMIELQRESVQIYRQLKQLKNGNNI